MHFEAQSLDGFAGWMYAQSEEEYGHAMRILKYMLERGAQVELKAIASPPEEFGSPLDIFKQALAHEQHVTKAIHALYKLAAEHEEGVLSTGWRWLAMTAPLCSCSITSWHSVQAKRRNVCDTYRKSGARSGSAFVLCLYQCAGWASVGSGMGNAWEEATWSAGNSHS